MPRPLPLEHPLWEVAASGPISVFADLLLSAHHGDPANHVDLNSPNAEGMTLLHVAVKNRQAANARLLLQYWQVRAAPKIS
jgi:ankyrin repeat protein